MAVLAALSLTTLLTLAAFSMSASMAYDRRNQMAALADAASKSGAFEARRNSSVLDSELNAFGTQAATLMGLSNGSYTLDVHRCTSVGATCTSPYNTAFYVEAIAYQSSASFLAGMLPIASLTPRARAVAGTASPSNCLIAMNNLEFGNTVLTMNGCDVGVGNNLTGSNPNAEVNGTPTPGVSVNGSCINNCGKMGNLATGQPDPVNPLAGLAAPTVSGSCVAGTAATLSPGCYSSIAGSVTTLQAGTYKVTGKISADNLSGTNVLVYLTGTGSIEGGNNGSLTLTASNSGAYAGIAIYGDAGSVIEAKNHFTMSVNGAIYMPGGDFDFKNHVTWTNTGCTYIIVNNGDIKNGDGAMSNDGCAGSFGNAAFLSVALAE